MGWIGPRAAAGEDAVRSEWASGGHEAVLGRAIRSGAVISDSLEDGPLKRRVRRPGLESEPESRTVRLLCTIV